MVHMAPTDTYTESVREAVIRALAAAGASVNAVAAGTGIPQSTLSRRINGSPFTLPELHRIAEHLGIPVGQLSDPQRAA
jgi:transposase InsO family protein